MRHARAVGLVGERKRDTHAAADIAQQGIQRGSVAAIGVRQGRETQGRQRHEHETDPQALNESAPDDMAARHIETELGHPVQRIGQQQHSDKDRQARIDASQDATGNLHGDHRADTARRHDQAGCDHRVALQVLQERRQQGEGGEQHDAQNRDDHQTSDQVSIPKQVR